MSERFGQYELFEKIAAGGMAEIFFGRLVGVQGFARNVVVKRMLPELSVRKDFVEMFLDEARLAANLNHPNLVQVYDLGEVDNAYFMAMEFIDGPHLGSLFAHSLRQGMPLPLHLCAWIIARAADGLNHAHEAVHPETGEPMNIVHRDISPQNILVSKFGDVKVTDFGVAKTEVQHTKTRTGVIKGKVAYMSPEQCLADSVDLRTDVFALGICLYELITRRRLYKEKSDLQIMTRITQEETRVPSELNASVGKELGDICLKALAKNVNDRYQNMTEFSLALDQWLMKNQHLQGKKSLAGWIKEKAPDIGPAIKRRKRGTGESSGLSGQWAQASEAPALGHTPATGTRNVPRGLDDASRYDDLDALGKTETFNSGTFEVITGKTELVSTDMIVEEQRDANLSGHVAAESMHYGVGAKRTKSPKAAQVAIIFAVLAMALGGLFFWQQAQEVPQGNLRITTIPSNMPVWLNGVEAGKTPILKQMNAGEVKVGVAFSGEPIREQKILVKANSEVQAEFLGLVVLDVETEPAKALIFINGALKGESPLTEGVRLKANVPFKLEIKKTGYATIEKVETPKPGARFALSYDLSKVRNTNTRQKRARSKSPAAPKEAPAASPVIQKTLDKIVAPVATEAVANELGFLTLKTNPWTTVRLGNRILGDTPVIKKRLKAGRHVLKLSNPERGIAMDLTVTIKAGEVLTKTVRINTGKINFSFLPPGVEIKVDGKRLGKTPMGDLTAYPGRHVIDIKSNGVTRKVTVQVKPGATLSVK